MSVCYTDLSSCVTGVIVLILDLTAIYCTWSAQGTVLLHMRTSLLLHYIFTWIIYAFINCKYLMNSPESPRFSHLGSSNTMKKFSCFSYSVTFIMCTCKVWLEICQKKNKKKHSHTENRINFQIWNHVDTKRSYNHNTNYSDLHNSSHWTFKWFSSKHTLLSLLK